MSAQRLTEKNTDEQDRTASRSAQDGPVRDTGREVVMKTTADARRRASTAGPTHVPDKELLAERVPRRRAANPATWMVPIFFGIIWAIDAGLKWTPEFQHTFMQVIKAGAATQPSWLGPWYQFWESALKPFAPSLALASAAIETVIAVALIVGFARKPLYILGALWSLGIWAIPEGFGNASRMAYTDIGTSIIYVTVFAALWALDSCTGPRRYSLDALIERRFPGWGRIAEVGQ